MTQRAEAIYGIDVGTFRDGNGDGVGDFRGLIESLDYVERLGVTTVWLLPFYPSPYRDNGYDVRDYYGIDPRFGSFGDFVDFIAEARQRRLDVIVDLVINHTSDEHPWFRGARENPKGPFRDYYHWTDDPPPLDEQPRPSFSDRVASVWTWDEAVGAFYYHQFYPFQPSLNHANPIVQDEVRRIMAFWLELGVTGFRIDAVGHIGEPALEPGSAEALEILRRYRSFAHHDGHAAILLGEADLPAEQLRRMLAPDAVSRLFSFLGNAHLYLGFVAGSAEPIARAQAMLGEAPGDCAWINFLRNLDEVDLERITDEERALVMERLAPERRMRLFDRGIRRRLAPMLDGDRRRLELAFSILMALPGVPMIVYGDEIGLGDDQRLPEREAVRTVMPWTDGPTAGFSSAEPEDVRPAILHDGPFGKTAVNVADQERDEGSLLAFVRAAIAVRSSTAGLRDGSIVVDAVADERVLRTCAGDGRRSIVTLHNLAADEVRLARPWEGGRGRVLLGAIDGADAEDGEVTIGPYGQAWIELERS